MESLFPADCDKASEISFCLEDEACPESVLNPEEAEELTQSLKEIVDSEEVKPKLQCLMSSPSFSLVTVQCEDSGIHWEASSSRCSTPWASEASTTSDVYSMESSSVGSLPGKVIFIMDEGKLRRKKVKSSSSGLSRHPKRNLNHQKREPTENMGEAFKQALEKAKDAVNTIRSPNIIHDEDGSSTERKGEAEIHMHDGQYLNNKKITEGIVEMQMEKENVAPCVLGKENSFMPSGKNISGISLSNPSSSLADKHKIASNVPPEADCFVPPNCSPKLANNHLNIENCKMDSPGTLSHVSENIGNLLFPKEENSLTHSELQDDTNDPPDTQSHVFSIVSDGSEILNILAPELISSVDQEASNEMQDKLEYLDENPLLIPKVICEVDNTFTDITNPTEDQVVKENNCSESIKKPETENLKQINPDKNTNEVDYFEKFTLIDDKIPIDGFVKPNDILDTGFAAATAHGTAYKSDTTDDDDNYYLLENLDESFYGVTNDDDLVTPHGEGVHVPSGIEGDSGTQDKDLKSAGITLFHAEEGVLAKSLFFPTSYPINPELLEEPPALAFLYKDLYEQAKGDKNKDENDPSDAESTSSVATFHSRISDDDGTGIYFEKYILKDEIPGSKTASSTHHVKGISEGVEEISVDQIYDIKDQDMFLDKSISKSAADDSQENEVNEWGLVNDEENIPDIQQTENEMDKSAIQLKAISPLLSYQIDKTQRDDEENVEGKLGGSLPNASVNKQRAQKTQGDIKVQEVENIAEDTFKLQRSQYERNVDVKDSKAVELYGEVQTKLDTQTSQRVSTEGLECLCLEDIEETAEDLDYVIVNQDDLLEDDLPHEEISVKNGQSLENDTDHSYDFIIDEKQDVSKTSEDSGFEIIEHERLPVDLSETSHEDEKKAQIDTYCYTCRSPILAIDKIFGDHKDHDVTTLDDAVNEMTTNLENLLEKLKESSMKTEDFVSRVEAMFNDVESNFTESEKVLEEQKEKMVQKLVDQHTEKRESFEEVKKMKLAYLYDQMVSFQQNVDTAREVIEKAAKEIEELDPVAFLTSHDEINNRLLSAMVNTLSLDKMPSAFSLFDQHAGNSCKGDQKSLKHIPVPHTPNLKPQEPNSATGNSITIYWTMSEEDVVDCFQVYCMEEPQGNRDENGLLEEYRVTVKESFCILEDLEPDKCYSVWVMAVNYTGCSLPSDRSAFRTAPSTPVIKAEECTVCWDMAIVRWSTAHPQSTETFTLEWCKQYPSEGEGLRSVAGIKDQQLKVTLQPNENYFFYVRAANAFGASEQSEAALISTKGTRFHLLRDTAHPALELSCDGSVISIPEQTVITGIPLVLGELLPARGWHYWEMSVTGSNAYSVGATFQPSKEEYGLEQDSTSWCMQCCSTPDSFSYKFLHNEVFSEVHLSEPTDRVGVLLDYRTGRLSFFNVQNGQVLFTFRHTFTEAAHPTFALETAGELHLYTGIELPRFTKHS
ncbi:cardiomyopathy-associated protein 5 [Rhinophrynus dorsalis]